MTIEVFVKTSGMHREHLENFWNVDRIEDNSGKICIIRDNQTVAVLDSDVSELRVTF